MEKKTWLKKGICTGVITLIAGSLIIGPALLAGDEYQTIHAQQAPVYSVKTIAAQKQTLRAFLEVNGDIINTRQADVFPDVSGKLVSVNTALGRYVRAGELIAEVDPSKPGSTYMNSPVYAPLSGIISRTPLSVGMTVSPNTSITVISEGKNLEISARIPEREIAGLALGLKAEVSLQAYPGETFDATVSRVSPVVDTTSRTKLINLSFDHPDERINAGMFARIRINSITYADVLTVPAEALVSGRGADTVYVIRLDEAGQPIAEKREVSRGLTLGGYTEIKAGLCEGEAVIVQGQHLLAGGEQVRIIGNSVAAAGGLKLVSQKQLLAGLYCNRQQTNSYTFA